MAEWSKAIDSKSIEIILHVGSNPSLLAQLIIKPMEYNKNGEVNRYYNLDDILKLNLPDILKEEFQTKFKKRVFYDNNGSCRMGILIGIEKNEKLSEMYYIVDVNGSKNFVPTWKSLTKV